MSMTLMPDSMGMIPLVVISRRSRKLGVGPTTYFAAATGPISDSSFIETFGDLNGGAADKSFHDLNHDFHSLGRPDSRRLISRRNNERGRLD